MEYTDVGQVDWWTYISLLVLRVTLQPSPVWFSFIFRKVNFWLFIVAQASPITVGGSIFGLSSKLATIYSELVVTIQQTCQTRANKIFSAKAFILTLPKVGQFTAIPEKPSDITKFIQNNRLKLLWYRKWSTLCGWEKIQIRMLLEVPLS